MTTSEQEENGADAVAVMHILLAHSLTAGREAEMSQEQRDRWAEMLEPHIVQIKSSSRSAEITTGLVKLFDRLYLDDQAYKAIWGETKAQSRERGADDSD